MVRSRTEIILSNSAAIICCLFFVAIVFVPLLSIALQFESLDEFFQTLIAATTLGPVRTSLIQSLTSTGLSLTVGSLIGVVLFRNNWGSPRIEWLLSVPYTVPTIVVALTWVSLLGVQGSLGFFNIGYSIGAVIVAHSFLNIPLVALTTLHALLLIPKDEIATARTLCPSSLSLLKYFWPQRLSSHFLMIGTQVFSLCMTSFIIVLILGGGPPVETLETGIYARIRFGNPQWAAASALAVWQIFLCSLPFLLNYFFSRTRRIEASSHSTLTKKSSSLWPLFICLPFGIIYALPFIRSDFLLQIPKIIRSAEFWNEAPPAVCASLSLSSLSTLIALIVLSSIVVCRIYFPKTRQLLSFLAQLPSGLSTLVLCLGLWLAYGSWIDPFEGKLFFIAVVQSIFLLPFMFRGLSSISDNSHFDFILEARCMGATLADSLREILWPTFKRTILLIITLSFATCLSEIAAVSFFYSEDFVPLSLLMSRWMGQYRFLDAQMIGLFLLLISVLVTSSSLSISSNPRGRRS